MQEDAIEARRWHLAGRVQGVGFRPFVYQLAMEVDAVGWVRNCGGGVEILAEASKHNIERLRGALISNLPPGAVVFQQKEAQVPVQGLQDFSIRPTVRSNASNFFPPTDICVCAQCLEELADRSSRRYRYPFINCAHCGPRYTLLVSMPYDRSETSMAGFALCPDCQAEYSDPADRRHHAQPLACGRCGPTLSWMQGAERTAGNEPSLIAAVRALREGLTIAVRGVGGYHLLCDASSAEAVRALRRDKNRPDKPFAILVPLRGWSGLAFARGLAFLSEDEERTLLSPERPIVLARPRPNQSIAPAVAPDLEELGLMLPCSPLLQLIANDFGGALVATSGNLSGEPIISRPITAEIQLGGVARGFLHHDREIARAADDSVFRSIANQCRPIRLGRGHSPQEFFLPEAISVPTVALGALQKNTVALAWENRVAISPHIGDLSTARGCDSLLRAVDEFETLYAISAEQIAFDAHPSIKARHLGRHGKLPRLPVGHHFAHASAIVGEFSVTKPMLCFTWDASGFGSDKSLWGGEALLGRPGAWTRVGSFRRFRLLGGEMAARQPWRSALAMCWEAELDWQGGARYADPDLRAAYRQRINCPQTSAVGRIFDAAAALLGLCTNATFSAQAAMRLEAICPYIPAFATAIPMPITLDADNLPRVDWRPLLSVLLDDSRSVVSRALLFHASLALSLCNQARQVRARHGVSIVGLSGGCFQNRILTELVDQGLREDGFSVCIPKRLPVNDGAISFGQIIEVAALANSPQTRHAASAATVCR